MSEMALFCGYLPKIEDMWKKGSPYFFIFWPFVIYSIFRRVLEIVPDYSFSGIKVDVFPMKSAAFSASAPCVCRKADVCLPFQRLLLDTVKNATIQS